MIIRLRVAILWLSVLIGLIASSCSHHDLTYGPTRSSAVVDVEFDWSDDPAASPSEMTVYFFRTETSRNAAPIVYDFKGRNGGRITLPVGSYSAICHNADSDSHGFVGKNSFDDFGLRLGDLKNFGDFTSRPSMLPRAAGAESERMANSPDSIWIASIPLVEIAEPVGSGAQVQTVRFLMQSVVHHYTFIIHNPINFKSATSIMASVSGMSATVHPGRGMTGDETVTHAFDMAPTPDGGLIGHLLTFGHCAARPVVGSRVTADPDSGLHSLVVYATLADGRNWYSTHDVTDQIHSSSTLDCVVHLDSISFPPASAGGGFRPNVGGWQGSGETLGM